jgi:uncharacterized protein (DUF1697 family)
MKYCAFLRGVNVKGTNMKMADVCQVFRDAGVKEVSSVIASGNIVFSSDKNVEELKLMLEKAMSTYFSYDAFLFIKSKDDVVYYWNNVPFDKSSEFHIYAFVGQVGLESLLMTEFQKATHVENEKGAIVNHTFYWQVPKGSTFDSTFGKILGRKSLKDQFTSRNINTFEKVLKKMDS